MPKVNLVDCIKQIIAINKELEEHDQRQDYHVTWMSQLRDRIDNLERKIDAKKKNNISSRS